jgi:hypothetical protein
MEHEKRLLNIQKSYLGNGNIPISTDAGIVTTHHSLAQWMAQQFNHNFDDYDRAIDAVRY